MRRHPAPVAFLCIVLTCFPVSRHLLCIFSIDIDDNLQPRQDVSVTVTDADGTTRQITMTCRIDTPVELEYYLNGGILQTVLRKLLGDSFG